jgi:hypothetical protein
MCGVERVLCYNNLRSVTSHVVIQTSEQVTLFLPDQFHYPCDLLKPYAVILK